MKIPDSKGRLVRNGKVQLQAVPKDKPKRNYTPRDDQLEQGRIRKAIEDRKIQRELLDQDLW